MTEYTFDASITVEAKSEQEASDKILEHLLDADMACFLMKDGTLNLAAVRALPRRNDENDVDWFLASDVLQALAGEQKHHPDCTVFAGPPYGDVCTCGLDTGEQE